MSHSTLNKPWRKGELFTFRVVFIFLLVLSVPFDRLLFVSIKNAPFSFETVFQLFTYRTSFIPESQSVSQPFTGYWNWLIALIVALVGTIIWYVLDKGKAKEYNRLYYFLRVFIRVRLALAVVTTGIIKLLPLQLPKPSLSDYHTEYGDFLSWKIYYLSTSVTFAGYVPAIGLLELLGGILLLFRKTAAIGSGLLIAVLSNVVISNFVFDIGEQVYSSFLLLLAIFIFSYDFPRFYSLLFLRVQTRPDPFWANTSSERATLKKVLRGVFVVVFVFFGIGAYRSYSSSQLPYSPEAGIKDTRGYYDVQSFVYNKDTLPYSLVDPVRWQNVVFESWNTISVRDNVPVIIDSTRPQLLWHPDSLKNFDKIGNAGRHFYRYTYSPAADNGYRLQLFEKSTNIKKYDLDIQIADSIIYARGADNKGDSLYVQLVRYSKKYLLDAGRRKPIKIY
ncbi:hypothetical protein U0035_20485 [Niabella yanshanensis]|uniref:DoxX family protein n=1 Tax=Niabella yanshanensis TaxID=577386 RepID=A0ABZ0W449_9BACT|nr:beta-carotene 15,15'-monooxygenase [Niabella yanshanensis]WQD38048.1 hypothetical protein U0035_20485 [Niabella yanshanensis]